MSEQSTPRNTEAAAPVHDVAVLGGGSFGTAMAKVLGENGHRVHFWMRGKAQAEEIRSTRINSR
ncbi:MAG TPA: glycerol-3-phosphate dehydrogenase, partial [Marinobacter adhaerens]|nr:glycerol-3-phosphate dehydrogenase [Marinobacter adhaerens]